MKSIISIISTVLLSTVAFAESTLTLHAEWTYVAPTDCAGFRFYNNKSLVADIKDCSAREADFSGIVNDGDNTFTLKAYDRAGQESPESPPFILNPVPASPIIKTIQPK